MGDQQDERDTSSPPAKKHRFQQDHIDTTQLYLTNKFSDVYFSIQSDDGTVTQVPAHKNLLAVASDVFEEMFYGELKENDDIKVNDASVAAFKEFLQFFYLSEGKLTGGHVAQVMYLGIKYNVEKCVEECVQILKDGLTNENVCVALALAIRHDQKHFMKACEKRIALNTANIFESAGFLECSRVALAHILRMNWLSCSEVDVFEACMKWVQAQSKGRYLTKALVVKHLGNLYYQIRFVSMTIEEFCTLKTKYSVVLSSDFEAIVRLIARMDIHSKHFNTSPREIKWNKSKEVPCFRINFHSPARWQALDIEEKITFSMNGPLLLGKFSSNGICYGEKEHKNLRSNLSVEVKITEARTLDDSSVKVLSNMTASLGSQSTNILLPQPILVRPDFFYTICIKGFPENYYFYSYQQQSLITPKSDIKIEFHNDKVVDGEIFGLIWRMYFNEI